MTQLEFIITLIVATFVVLVGIGVFARAVRLGHIEGSWSLKIIPTSKRAAPSGTEDAAAAQDRGTA